MVAAWKGAVGADRPSAARVGLPGRTVLMSHCRSHVVAVKRSPGQRHWESLPSPVHRERCSVARCDGRIKNVHHRAFLTGLSALSALRPGRALGRGDVPGSFDKPSIVEKATARLVRRLAAELSRATFKPRSSSSQLRSGRWAMMNIVTFGFAPSAPYGARRSWVSRCNFSSSVHLPAAGRYLSGQGRCRPAVCPTARCSTSVHKQEGSFAGAAQLLGLSSSRAT